MDWIGIISLSIGFYILGYDTGAKDVLKKPNVRKLKYYESKQDECIHNYEYEYCPDCRH